LIGYDLSSIFFSTTAIGSAIGTFCRFFLTDFGLAVAGLILPSSFAFVGLTPLARYTAT
jgi:hypothetical protein